MRKGLKNPILITFLLMITIYPVIPQDNSESFIKAVLLTPEEFFLYYAPKINSLEDSKTYLDLHRRGGRRIMLAYGFTAPSQRSLIPTDIGYLDVIANNSSLGITTKIFPLKTTGPLDSEKPRRLRIDFVHAPSLAVLVPLTPEDVEPAIASPARLDICMLLNILYREYNITFGLQHVSESEISENKDLFLVYDKPRAISYSIDPFQDRILFSVTHPALQLQTLFQNNLEHFLVGKTFIPGAASILHLIDQINLAAIYDSLSGAHQFGPRITLTKNRFSAHASGSYVTEREENSAAGIPLAGALSLSWRNEISLFDIVKSYFAASAGLEYHPYTEGFFPRLYFDTGLYLFQQAAEGPFGFFITLAGGYNDKTLMNKIPVYNQWIISGSFGFSFL